MQAEIRADAYRVFFGALQKGGVDAIIKAASELFESPVLFTDHNYRLICQFPNAPIGEPIWDRLYETKMLLLETIWDFQNAFLTGMEDVYKPFYADWGYVANWPRIFGEVYTGEQIIGHVAVFLGAKPFQVGDLELTQLLIDTLKVEIRSRVSEHSSWKPTASTYFVDLLSGETTHPVKSLAAQSLAKLIVGDYAIISTPLSASAAKRAFATYAVTELTRQYRNIVPAIYKDSVVTLIGEIKPESFDPAGSAFVDRITRFFANHNMTSGISLPFRDFHQIGAHFIQAELTAQLALRERNGYLGTFSDYAPMQMFLALSREGPPEAYVHPALATLRAHDREHHTEYFETLRVYSLSMHNKDIAAVRLAVHRNTLLYRLNRIRDLFQIDMENGREALHLLASFMLLAVL